MTKVRDPKASGQENEVAGLIGLSTGSKLGPFILSRARSTVHPWLVLEDDRMRYRVLRTSEWAYVEIGEVDLLKRLGSFRIGFTALRGGRFLWADFRDMPSAARVIAKLPSSLTLRPRAATARDSLRA